MAPLSGLKAEDKKRRLVPGPGLAPLRGRSLSWSGTWLILASSRSGESPSRGSRARSPFPKRVPTYALCVRAANAQAQQTRVDQLWVVVLLSGE